MISYEPADSIYFKTNKTYCESVEEKLKQMNTGYSGFCNSFGYSIQTAFDKDGLEYNLTVEKYQSTRNGVYYPVNAQNCDRVTILIKGVDSKINLLIGKNKIRRILLLTKNKKQIPDPYFVSFNSSQFKKEELNLIINKVVERKISLLKIRRGTVKIKVHHHVNDPVSFSVGMGLLLSSALHRDII